MWDLTTGSPIPDQGGRPDGVRNVAFDPVDPAVLAVTTTTGAVAFLDVTSDAVIGEPARVHGNGMRSISFSASGRALAAFADDRRISLWGDGNSPGLIDSPFSADPDLDHAVFSPDRSHVLLFGDLAELRRVEDPSAPGVAMSPPAGSGDTGYYLAAFDGNGTRVLLGPTDISGYVADAANGQAVWSAPPRRDYFATSAPTAASSSPTATAPRSSCGTSTPTARSPPPGSSTWGSSGDRPRRSPSHPTASTSIS